MLSQRTPIGCAVAAGNVADGGAQTRGVNVGRAERVLSLAGGGLLAWLGVKQGSIDAIGEQRDQAFAVCDLGPQHVGRGRQRVGPNLGIAGIADLAKTGVGDDAADEYFGLGRHAKILCMASRSAYAAGS